MDPDLFTVQWVSRAEIEPHTNLTDSFDRLCAPARNSKCGMFVKHNGTYAYMVPSPSNARDDVLECKTCKSLMLAETFAYHTCFTGTPSFVREVREDQCGIITSGVVIHPVDNIAALKNLRIGAPLWMDSLELSNKNPHVGRPVGIYAGPGPYIDESPTGVPTSSVIVLLLR